MMKTSRSGHYYKSKDKKSDAFLLEKIREVATVFPCYGYRRIMAHLRRNKIMVNR